MGMGGAYQDAIEREQKLKAQAKADFLASEDAAAYNYQEIRKLQRQIEAAAEHRHRQRKRIQELERRTKAQARAITAQSKLIDSVKELFKAELAWKIEELEKEAKRRTGILEGLADNQGQVVDQLADARCDHAELVRLVQRMGRDLDTHCADTMHEATDLQYPYTIIGQREYEAAMHDAEGPDVKREDCVP